MADERNYYVLCENNCKFPAMTKEQILAAIEQAVSTGEIKNVDTGFVTKIKEKNAAAPLSFWVGTQAEYNALADKAANCFYIITDDTTEEDINKNLKELNAPPAIIEGVKILETYVDNTETQFTVTAVKCGKTVCVSFIGRMSKTATMTWSSIAVASGLPKPFTPKMYGVTTVDNGTNCVYCGVDQNGLLCIVSREESLAEKGVIGNVTYITNE